MFHNISSFLELVQTVHCGLDLALELKVLIVFLCKEL